MVGNFRAVTVAIGLLFALSGLHPASALVIKPVKVLETPSNIISIHHKKRRRAIIAGVIAGAIIAGAIANSRNRDRNYNRRYRAYPRNRTYRTYRRTRYLSDAHIGWCHRRYRSYRVYDNTFQPYRGRRRPCYSPYY